MDLQEIANITFATLVAIIAFCVFMILKLYKQKRRGTMKTKTRIEFCSGEVLCELRTKYEDWGFGSLESLRSLDKYIDEKRGIYSVDDLLNDQELIFKLAAFTGELIRYRKKYAWKITDDEPYMVKKGSTIFPFDKIRKRIKDGASESIYHYAKLL